MSVKFIKDCNFAEEMAKHDAGKEVAAKYRTGDYTKPKMVNVMNDELRELYTELVKEKHRNIMRRRQREFARKVKRITS